MHECRDEFVEETVLLSEEGVGIAYGTAQDTTDDITCLGIAGQLTVGNRESDSTQVVGADTHGDIDVVLLFADRVDLLFLEGEILQSRDVLLCLDDRLEDIGVVVGVLPLHHTNQTLKAHTRVDDIHGEFFEGTVCLAVKLHEHEVPYLDDLRVVLVDEFTPRLAGGCFLLWGTGVYVYLRARTTGTCVAHLPEVIMLITIDDMILRHMLCPVFRSLVVTRDVLFGRTLEDGNIEILGIQFQHIHQILPCHINGTFLEIVTERPVAQHLKHGVVVGVMSYLLQVVMLTTDAQTLLGIGAAAWLWVTCA